MGVNELVQRRMTKSTKKFNTEDWKGIRERLADEFDDGSVDVFYYYGNLKFNCYDHVGSCKPEDLDEAFSRFRCTDQIIIQFANGELEYLDRM